MKKLYYNVLKISLKKFFLRISLELRGNFRGKRKAYTFDKVENFSLFVSEVIIAILSSRRKWISKFIRLYYIPLANIEYVPKQLA